MALTFGLTACNNKNSDIIGAWESSDKSTVFEFSKDGTLTIVNPSTNDTVNGTWSRNEGHLYLVYEGEEDVIDAQILSVDKNSLVLKSGDDSDDILYLKRIKDTSANRSTDEIDNDSTAAKEQITELSDLEQPEKDESAEEEETTTTTEREASSRYINGHEYVDLGLSVKWATCNVGANSPSDYGNHYAWGEITPKSSYTEENCKTSGKNLGSIAGNPNYDAARANWGGTWRLPTEEEIDELIDNCQWEWTTIGEHSGYKITSKNGNSIFLPAAGYREDSSCINNDGGDPDNDGNYWSATPDGSNTQYACCLELISGHYNFGAFTEEYLKESGLCYLGFSVRPVSK
ncbi:MAG: DUF5640 domain-containing protein [Clostridia bacterium]|nr:DUF5640 domain-containing protein [Clostridia bacterium]